LWKPPAEARRLISQGFVTVDGQRFLDVNEHIDVKDGMISESWEIFLFVKKKSYIA
jgi:ribosomal protein S4